MKRLVGIIFVVAFTTFAVVDAIHGFVSSDGFHYFSAQPRRLLFVAGIGIVGGLIAFGFSVLSPGLQRGVKLVVLGLGASFVLLGGGYLSFQIANLPVRLDPTTARLVPATPRQIPWLLVLGTIGIAGLIWFEFYQVVRHRDCVA